MTATILVTDWDFPDLSIEETILSGTDVRLEASQAGTDAEVIEAAEAVDADALLVQQAPVTRAVFETLELAAVGRYGIGVDTVDLAAAADHGVTVCNVPDYCRDEVPTHALGLLLAVARRIAAYDREVTDGTWDWTTGRPIDRVVGSTLGLVGFGTLPRRLVELVAGFDFEILVADPYVGAEEIAAAGGRKVELDELVASARVVSLHAPLTDETRGMIGADALSRMREDAVVINTARGELVDVDALVAAVERGEIAGAGLDVLPEEPPPSAPPDHPRIVYTPHVAWYSEDSITTLRRTVTRDVLRVLRGEPPDNPVAGPGADAASTDGPESDGDREGA
jgi:D-3-phosphoglycerate dehydrogenase